MTPIVDGRAVPLTVYKNTDVAGCVLQSDRVGAGDKKERKEDEETDRDGVAGHGFF